MLSVLPVRLQFDFPEKCGLALLAAAPQGWSKSDRLENRRTFPGHLSADSVLTRTAAKFTVRQ